jgi:hypothetical protein
MLRRLLCCLSLGLVAAVASPVAAQKLEDGRNRFELMPEIKATRELRKELRTGRIPYDAKDKDHKTAVAIMAAEAVYPLFWDGVESFKSGKLNRTVEDWTGTLGYLSSKNYREKTTGLQQALVREVTDRCAEVIKKSPKPVISVNAAMLLARIPERAVERGALQTREEWADDVAPRLADGNGDHLVTTCVDLLNAEQAKDGKKDRPNDGVRYYLFRSLSGALSVPLKKEAIKKETEEKAVQTALDFLAKAPKPGKTAPREEVEGFKVLRREAVKVVAASRSADLGEKGRPALVLARIAAADASVSPPPRTDEQLEAACGLARMIGEAAARSPSLQTDYAAWCVLLAVYDFAVDANKDVEKSKALERRRPWVVEAARFLEAVERMAGDGKTTPPYVSSVLRQCSEALSAIQGGKGAGAAELGQWEKDNRPSAKSLYKDVEDSVVKRAAPDKDE